MLVEYMHISYIYELLIIFYSCVDIYRYELTRSNLFVSILFLYLYIVLHIHIYIYIFNKLIYHLEGGKEKKKKRK